MVRRLSIIFLILCSACLAQQGAFKGQGTSIGQQNIVNGPPAIPPTVSISPSVANLATSATQQFTATVTNDNFSLGVLWSLVGPGCSGNACGTLSQPQSKSGVPITYTAPSSAPVPNQVILVATSLLNPISASSASVVIIVTAPPPPIAVRNTCVPGSQTTALTNTFSCQASLGNAVEVTIYNGPSVTVTGVKAGTIPLTQVCSPTNVCRANSGGVSIQKWYGIGLPAGITTYTVTNTSPSSLMGISVIDLSNIIALDTASFASFTVATTGPIGPAVTTTGADIIIPSLGVTGTTTGIAAPFTFIPGVVFGNGLAYTISATTGTFNPNWITTSGTAAGATSSYIGGIPTPVISVSVAPTTASVKVNTTASFTPTVTNDSKGVNWALTGAGCSGSTCGILSATTTASGVPVTYTAPTTVPSPATVTLTASSITNPLKTATATITVTSNPIVVNLSPGSANVVTSATQTFSCTVTNDAANAGCDYTLTGAGCSGATCGTLSAAHAASGVNITYTAPGSVPSPAIVTLTATSTTDNTKNDTSPITVVAAPVLTVTIAPGTATVPVNGTQNFTPTVTNDGSNLGVDWTLTGSCTIFSDNFSGGVLSPNWAATTASGVEGGGSFSPSHISMSQGVLQMNVTQDGTTAGSVGAEIELNRLFGYGTYSWSMQAAGTSATQGGSGSAVSGQISSTFQYSGGNPSPTEIDAPEIEGQFPNQIEYTTWVNGVRSDFGQTTLTNPQNTYHVYKYIWQPGKIQFFLDGTLSFTTTTNIPTAPAHPITNLWGTNSTSFGGLATPGVTRYMYINNFTYSNCGTLSATHTASGTPVTYTAPANVPSPATVTITATSTTDNTKSASSTITVGTPPNITVAVAPTTANVTTNGVQNVTATVTNDTSNLGVTWSLSCTGGNCGSISPTMTASGVAAVYTAPNSVPSPATVTVTATSVTAPTKIATATFTIVAPVITVTVAPTTATLQAGGQTQSFTATVANSGSGVNWTLTGSTCTGASCGTLSATTSLSGVPITYTSPSVNTSQTVTLTATSIADGTKTASATIHVNANTTQPSCANTPCPAFLGTGVNGNFSAQGGGAATPGGRGGVVYEVTTLADVNGACTATAVGFTNCSFRQAYNSSQGCTARYVIFRVAGVSAVTANDLRTSCPFMTVEGHSAPGEVIIGGPGTNGALGGISTHDVILRYITYSPDNINTITGPSGGTTSIWIVNCGNIKQNLSVSTPPPDNSGCYNIINDHVTTRWTGNKSWITTSNFTPTASVAGVGPNNKITSQWTLDYEPEQGHPVGYGTATDEACVSTAAAGGCLSRYEHDVDFHHSFFANIGHRIPETINWTQRWTNNIVYNWAFYANEFLGAMNVDVINNKYITGNLNAIGPSQTAPVHVTCSDSEVPTFGSQCASGQPTSPGPELSGPPSIYIAGNIVGAPGTNTVLSNQLSTSMLQMITGENGNELGAINNSYVRSSPMAASNAFPIIPDLAANLDTVLLPYVGNWAHLDGNGVWVSHRDPQDTRIINQYKNGSAGGHWPNGVTYEGICYIPPNPSPCPASCSSGCLPQPTVQPNWTDTPQTQFPLQVESLHDGIPDAWKKLFNLSTTDTALYKRTDNTTGLPYIEDYYDGLVPNATAPSTFTAASCNESDVSSAITAEKVHPIDGDIIAIPTGSCAWSTELDVTFANSITIQGAGAKSATTGGATTTGSDLTILNIGAGGQLHPTTTAGKSFRITGIAFLTSGGNPINLFIDGASTAVRVDHCHFYTTFESMEIDGSVQGVADHNFFDGPLNSVIFSIAFHNGQNWNGASNDPMGNSSWVDTEHWGSGEFFFAEDNNFNADIGDGHNGARYVIRHNTMQNSYTNQHGDQMYNHGVTPDPARGVRAVEMYLNNAIAPTGTGNPLLSVNSGAALFWSNTMTQYRGGAAVDYYNREHQPGGNYTYTAPPNGWGYCGSANGGPTNWDQNTNAQGYACIDQPGRGAGDLLSGTVFPGIVNQTQGNVIAWPHQALVPIYSWNNALTSSYTDNILAIQNTSLLTDNVDYYQQFGTFGEPGSFNGTKGVGQGLLSARTATCTAGVAYWATDTNTLYVCNPTNTWTTYYTPFTYPHPLNQ